VPEPDDSLLGEEKRMVANFKKAVLMAAGGAAQKLGLGLSEEQEIVMHISDMVIDTYLAESVLLRTLKLAQLRDAGPRSAEGFAKAPSGAGMTEQVAMCQVFIHDAADRIHKHAKEAVNAFSDGDERQAMLMGAKRFTKSTPFNSKVVRRSIAARLVKEGKNPF
jgi:hypothetical protein